MCSDFCVVMTLTFRSIIQRLVFGGELYENYYTNILNFVANVRKKNDAANCSKLIVCLVSCKVLLTLNLWESSSSIYVKYDKILLKLFIFTSVKRE